MLLPKNIKTSSSHPSAVSSRKHCSEGHCGMPSSPIHHQVSFLVSRPTILVSLLSSFCDNSHTLSLPPWQVTREPKPKYIQICLKQCHQNCPKLINSIFSSPEASPTDWTKSIPAGLVATPAPELPVLQNHHESDSTRETWTIDFFWVKEYKC